MLGNRRRRWHDDASWWKRHSLSLVLAAMLVAQTIHALWSGAYVFEREEPLGKGLGAFGQEFWMWWGWEYNVSLVADTFGVLLIVMMSKWFYEEHSAESNGKGSEDGEGEPAAR